MRTAILGKFYPFLSRVRWGLDPPYKLLNYADDSVIYIASKDVTTINNMLTEDLNLLANWFDHNELLINLKKGKTECLLFGTNKRISKQKEPFHVQYRDTCVVKTNNYKYLGVDLTSNLKLTTYFDRCYKKATSRLRLLQKLRNMLTIISAKAVYSTFIIPCLVYCSILNINLTSTQIYKLDSIQRRASHIIYGNTPTSKTLPSIVNMKKIRACQMLKDCIDKKSCEELISSFSINSHEINTRNNGYLLKIPKCRTEYGKRSFTFMATKVFNKLPLDIRKNFKNEYFMSLVKAFLFSCKQFILAFLFLFYLTSPVLFFSLLQFQYFGIL